MNNMTTNNIFMRPFKTQANQKQRVNIFCSQTQNQPNNSSVNIFAKQPEQNQQRSINNLFATNNSTSKSFNIIKDNASQTNTQKDTKNNLFGNSTNSMNIFAQQPKAMLQNPFIKIGEKKQLNQPSPTFIDTNTNSQSPSPESNQIKNMQRLNQNIPLNTKKSQQTLINFNGKSNNEKELKIQQKVRNLRQKSSKLLKSPSNENVRERKISFEASPKKQVEKQSIFINETLNEENKIQLPITHQKSYQNKNIQFKSPDKKLYNQNEKKDENDHRPLSTIRQNSFEESALHKNSLSVDYSNFSSSEPDFAYMNNASSSDGASNNNILKIQKTQSFQQNIINSQKQNSSDSKTFSKNKSQFIPVTKDFQETNPTQNFKITESQKISGTSSQQKSQSVILGGQKEKKPLRLDFEKLKNQKNKLSFQKDLSNQFQKVWIKRIQSESDSESNSHSFVSKQLTPSKKQEKIQLQQLSHGRKELQLQNNHNQQCLSKYLYKSNKQAAIFPNVIEISDKQIKYETQLKKQAKQVIKQQEQVKAGKLQNKTQENKSNQISQIQQMKQKAHQQVQPFVQVNEVKNNSQIHEANENNNLKINENNSEMKQNVSQESDRTISLDYSRSTVRIQSSTNTLANQTVFKAQTRQQKIQIKKQVNIRQEKEIQKEVNQIKIQSQSQQYQIPTSNQRKPTATFGLLSGKQSKNQNKVVQNLKVPSKIQRFYSFAEQLSQNIANKTQLKEQSQKIFKEDHLRQYRNSNSQQIHALKQVNKEKVTIQKLIPKSPPKNPTRSYQIKIVGQAPYSPTHSVLKNQGQRHSPGQLFSFEKKIGPGKSSLFGNDISTPKYQMSASLNNVQKIEVKQNKKTIQCKKNALIEAKQRMNQITRNTKLNLLQLEKQGPFADAREFIDQRNMLMNYLYCISNSSFATSNFLKFSMNNNSQETLKIMSNISHQKLLIKQIQNISFSGQNISEKFQLLYQTYQNQLTQQINQIEEKRKENQKKKENKNKSLFQIFNIKRNKYCAFNQKVVAQPKLLQQNHINNQKPYKALNNFKKSMNDFVDNKKSYVIKIQKFIKQIASDFQKSQLSIISMCSKNSRSSFIPEIPSLRFSNKKQSVLLQILKKNKAKIDNLQSKQFRLKKYQQQIQKIFYQEDAFCTKQLQRRNRSRKYWEKKSQKFRQAFKNNKNQSEHQPNLISRQYCLDEKLYSKFSLNKQENIEQSNAYCQPNFQIIPFCKDRNQFTLNIFRQATQVIEKQQKRQSKSKKNKSEKINEKLNKQEYINRKIEFKREINRKIRENVSMKLRSINFVANVIQIN